MVLWHFLHSTSESLAELLIRYVPHTGQWTYHLFPLVIPIQTPPSSIVLKRIRETKPFMSLRRQQVPRTEALLLPVCSFYAVNVAVPGAVAPALAKPPLIPFTAFALYYNSHILRCQYIILLSFHFFIDIEHPSSYNRLEVILQRRSHYG